MPDTSFVMFGAIAAAFITGIITLTRIVISKEQKISDLRHHWLTNFRKELASLLGLAETLTRLAEKEFPGNNGLTEAQLATFRKSHKNEYLKLNTSRYIVLLRLNPTEHKTLIDALKKLIDSFYGSCNNIEEINNAQASVSNEAQTLIKSVWDNVRVGEPLFKGLRMSLIIAIPVLLVVFIVCGVVFYNSTTKKADTKADGTPTASATP